jgi:hypothetical protein
MELGKYIEFVSWNIATLLTTFSLSIRMIRLEIALSGAAKTNGLPQYDKWDT